MDPRLFDDLTRLLGGTSGRRALLRVLLGVSLGSVPPTAAARKRDTAKPKAKDQDQTTAKAKAKDHGPEPAGHADPERAAASHGAGRKRRKKGGGGGQAAPLPAGCCGSRQCAPPKTGSTRARCDYAGASFAGHDLTGAVLRGIDGREASFTTTTAVGAVFDEACLQGARFRRARLEGSTWTGACLFAADFTGADVGEATVFARALFCRTLMPDGSRNDRDCDQETACCRAEPGGGGWGRQSRTLYPE